MSMVAFIPNTPGDFTVFQRDEAEHQLEDVLNTLWTTNYPALHTCSIKMPKFSISYKAIDMKAILNNMGVHDIFASNTANFTSMTPSDNLYVTNVEHAAAIKVSEGGIKASAASSIMTGWRITPRQASLQKPFVFLIRHEATGSVLFLGKLTKPHYIN